MQDPPSSVRDDPAARKAVDPDDPNVDPWVDDPNAPKEPGNLADDDPDIPWSEDDFPDDDDEEPTPTKG